MSRLVPEDVPQLLSGFDQALLGRGIRRTRLWPRLISLLRPGGSRRALCGADIGHISQLRTCWHVPDTLLGTPELPCTVGLHAMTKVHNLLATHT